MAEEHFSDPVPRDSTSFVDRMAELVEEVTPTHFRTFRMPSTKTKFRTFRMPSKKTRKLSKACKPRLSNTSAAGSYFMTLVRTLERHGEFHEETAQAYENLGYTYKLFGKIGKAIKCHRRALAIRKELFGESHAATALSLSHVAECLRLEGSGASQEYDELSVKTMGRALANASGTPKALPMSEKLRIESSYQHDIGM